MKEKKDSITGRTFWDILGYSLKNPKLLIGTCTAVVLLLLTGIILVLIGNLQISFMGEKLHVKTVAGRAVESKELFINLKDKNRSNSLQKVFVVPFEIASKEDSLSISGELLEGLTEKFSLKLTRFYNVISIKPDPAFSSIQEVIRYLNTIPENMCNYGVLMGRFVSVRNEAPEKSRKAEISVNMSLYDNQGETIWVGSQTYSGTATKPGKKLNDSLYRPALTAIELLEISSTDFINELGNKLK